MRDLFIKKTFLGLVGLLLVVSLLGYPGNINIVEAERGAANISKAYENVGSLQATNQVFFDANTTWKYFDKGQVPGNDWNATAFNDSAWPSGAATLGYGNGGEKTIVSYGSSSSKKYITTYFRKSFTIDNAAAVTALNLTLVKDDGAVVYLNGKEVLRDNMPTGKVENTTRASTCSSKKATQSIDPRLLVSGTNVLAVEVHQCEPGSSDLALSASLTGTITIVPTATATAVQPAATDPAPQDSGPVDVVPTVVDPTVAAPVDPTMTATAEQPTDPTADPTTLPTLDPTLDPAVQPTIEITAPAPTQEPTAAPPTPVLPVVDPGSEASFEPAAAAQTGTVALFGLNGTWRYYDKGQLPGSNWTAVAFNANNWPVGIAPLGYGNGDERTRISYGSSSSNKYITTYFRKAFAITNAATATGLTLTVNKDDGAVVYLNGREVLRANMPSGTITNTTRASSCSSTPVTKAIDPRLLVTGTNVISVEVHQCEPGSSDLSFSAALVGKFGSGSVAPTAVPTQPPAPTATTKPTTPPASPSNVWYVAPNGSSGGNGSRSNPWNLQTALNHPSSVKPGHTIFLLPGTYTGAFKSNLRGSSSGYISVRAYPHTRVTLINNSGPALEIMNSWYVNFWGLEITSNYSKRSTSRSESTYGIRVNQGSSNAPHHVRFINMVVHDVQAQGIGWWQALRDSEIHGSLFYYNGTTELDHGVYAHNVSGTKVFRDNIVFDNASHGYHGYAETTSKGLNNLQLIGNTFFNNGSIGYNTRKGTYGTMTRNILVGGLIRANNPLIQENYTYHTGSAGTSLNLGYQGGSANARIYNNYFMGGQLAFGGSNSGVAMTGNTVYSPGGTNGFNKASYSNNSWLSSKPSGTKIFVRRNGFESTRANITIYNWSRQSTVTIPASYFSSVNMQAGDKFELHNVQNFYGDVITGTYNGSSIVIPMTGRSVAQPVGLSFRPASTFPEFGAFVLIAKVP